MSVPEIFKNASEGAAKFYLQFGGQGSPWLKELNAYYQNDDAIKKVIDVGLTAIEEEVKKVGETIGLPHGLDARGWLDNPESIPSEEYLGCAAVSIPMIELTQLAHFEKLVQSGYSRTELIANSAGATGHSQGIIPASLVAMGLDGDEYLQGVAKFIKYLFYLGVRSQEVHPHFAATAAETEKSQSLGSKGEPSPMVAFLGSDHDTIRGLVEELNKELPPKEIIHISLINSPTNRILSSFRSSLIKFHEKNKAFIDENKLKYVYLRTSCPFHSPLMEGFAEVFEKDLDTIDFNYKGSDLKIPVWSFYDGKNYQESDNLRMKMGLDMVLHPLYWDKAMQPTTENGTTHVLDYGPGKTSKRLSEDTLKGLGKELPVLAAGVPKDLKVLLA